MLAEAKRHSRFKRGLIAVNILLAGSFFCLLIYWFNDFRPKQLEKAKEIELRINAYRKKLRKGHFKSVEQGEYNFKSATVYSNLFNSLEKIGDYIINVSEGLVNDFDDFDEENEND